MEKTTETRVMWGFVFQDGLLNLNGPLISPYQGPLREFQGLIADIAWTEEIFRPLCSPDEWSQCSGSST